VVSKEEMVDRIKASVDARSDPSFVIIARTDALAMEGPGLAIERAVAYVQAGADMIFAEAVSDLGTYQEFSRATGVPILANITEFGKTPLFTTQELKSAGVSMALYPLSAFRAMSAAALNVYETLRKEGSQINVLPQMQTRAELYDILNYYAYEQKLDQLFAREKME
jgi:methylisocitrate lyase